MSWWWLSLVVVILIHAATMGSSRADPRRAGTWMSRSPIPAPDPGVQAPYNVVWTCWSSRQTRPPKYHRTCVYGACRGFTAAIWSNAGMLCGRGETWAVCVSLVSAPHYGGNIHGTISRIVFPHKKKQTRPQGTLHSPCCDLICVVYVIRVDMGSTGSIQASKHQACVVVIVTSCTARSITALAEF